MRQQCGQQRGAEQRALGARAHVDGEEGGGAGLMGEGEWVWVWARVRVSECENE